MIERLEGQVAQQGERIKQLEDELRAQKKLKGKPKLKASQTTVYLSLFCHPR
jgi:hypothetical protein